MRFTLFVNGCPLRCQYCHNPDTWMMREGRRVTADRMMEEIGKYARALRISRGGLTITGGEPMLQIKFTGEIFRRAKHDFGLDTCLDTSGFLGDRASEEYLDNLDLVILDIKSGDPATFRLVTSVDIGNTLRFARRLSDRGNHMWIRFVLVPGLTDAAKTSTRSPISWRPSKRWTASRCCRFTSSACPSGRSWACRTSLATSVPPNPSWWLG